MSDADLITNHAEHHTTDPDKFDAIRVARKQRLADMAHERGESFAYLEECLAIVDGLHLGRGMGLQRLAESRQRLGW